MSIYALSSNRLRLKELQPETFLSLRLDERHNLQEWISSSPEVLTEPLLIIAKEYDDFVDTNDRLDLLALDKQGRLVVIENKIDDSGKGVVGQALKYASFLADVDHDRVISIFTEYCGCASDADKALCQFFNVSHISKLPKLNVGNSQRIILVAGKFCREVTSSAIWLRNKGIDIECHETDIYRVEDNIVVAFRRILPRPDKEEMKVHVSRPKAILPTKMPLQLFRRRFVEFNADSQGPFSDSMPQGMWPVVHSMGFMGVKLMAHASLSAARLEVFATSSYKERDKRVMAHIKKMFGKLEEQLSDYDCSWDKISSTQVDRFTVRFPERNYRQKEEQMALCATMTEVARSIADLIELLLQEIEYTQGKIIDSE